MSQQVVSKHAAPRRAPLKPLRTSAVLAGVAIAVTGASVAGGVLASPDPSTVAGQVSGLAVTSAAGMDDPGPALAGRAAPVSRSDSRDPKVKRRALSTTDGPSVRRREESAPSDPRDIARALLSEYGFSADQFGCLDALYVSESDWDVHADNPTSSAYGIPQALTETHDVPAGYFDSAEVQIRWGLDYIRDSYGTPCSAWEFKQGNDWY